MIGQFVGALLAQANPEARQLGETIRQQVEQQMARGPFDSPTIVQLFGVLTPFALFALIGLSVWLLIRKSQAQTQARTEFHRQLLDKFASGREFSEFLETKGSQRLLEGLWSRQVNAKERILWTARGGVVLTVLGLGAVGLSWKTPRLFEPGILILALGIGFLISTAISYRLSKKLGLLRDQESRSESDATSLS